MRKFATTALTALSITLLGSAAALADAPAQGAQGPGYQGPGYNQPHNGPQNPQQGQWNQGPRGGDRNFEDRRFDNDDDHFGGERGFEDRRFDGRHDRRFNDRNRNFNFNLHFGNFDRWERGWGYGNYQNQYRYHQVLNRWQIERVLERQGYYGVRGLQKARGGFGYRAFAFNQRGRPVMLRVNPFTGRVMDVRYI
ncbi:MAG: hypothetical protein ACKVRO_13390 [Micropepsaceae bacterium]